MTQLPLLDWLAAALFGLALLHCFSTTFFQRLAARSSHHGGLWHLLGEVEIVFGVWALVLILTMVALQGPVPALAYLESRNFTEPLFVFSVMVIAATRPVLQVATALLNATARLLPLPTPFGHFLSLMILIPLLGSFITEPAAMTLAALNLHQQYFAGRSARFRYATLAVLLVNVSIGGTLTHFAAPPVLMVAQAWSWDLSFMLSQFGWKAAIAVSINALGLSWFLRSELRQCQLSIRHDTPAPVLLKLMHLLFLAGVVAFGHHSVVFISLLLFFIGLTDAYKAHQDRLILREALLVAFFLAGLVTLGGMQQWWLQPLLLTLNPDQVFFGAAFLTAVTDNAALTYLGSLVDGLSADFKYSLVAGAVAGGGLTLIANAPNPAGFAILKPHFGGTAHPGRLFLAALPPTLVAMLCLRLL